MKQRTAWLGLSLLCLIAFACFFYPMYVIRPFRGQRPTELALALEVKRWGPWLAIACAAVSLFFFLRVQGRWARAGALVLSLLTIGFAALSHLNVYEKMFHPNPTPDFIAADQAKVDGDDMVLAVSLSGGKRAYPIRTMGYHHIVNDTVGGEPIVATY